MRKKRILIFEDDERILMFLKNVFEDKGYEVLAYDEPQRCPIYGDTLGRCDNIHLCGDLSLADFQMPRMTGLEMILLQEARGCKTDIRNKAILSGNVSH